MAIKFVLNETSYFGDNARENLASEIQKRNFKKVLDKFVKYDKIAKQTFSRDSRVAKGGGL